MTELKGESDMYLNKLYIHTNMCLNMVTRQIEDLLSTYQSIKWHSEFHKYFVLDRSHPSYYWNPQ